MQDHVAALSGRVACEILPAHPGQGDPCTGGAKANLAPFLPIAAWVRARWKRGLRGWVLLLLLSLLMWLLLLLGGLRVALGD